MVGESRRRQTCRWLMDCWMVGVGKHGAGLHCQSDWVKTGGAKEINGRCTLWHHIIQYRAVASHITSCPAVQTTPLLEKKWFLCCNLSHDDTYTRSRAAIGQLLVLHSRVVWPGEVYCTGHRWAPVGTIRALVAVVPHHNTIVLAKQLLLPGPWTPAFIGPGNNTTVESHYCFLRLWACGTLEP